MCVDWPMPWLVSIIVTKLFLSVRSLVSYKLLSIFVKNDAIAIQYTIEIELKASALRFNTTPYLLTAKFFAGRLLATFSVARRTW